MTGTQVRRSALWFLGGIAGTLLALIALVIGPWLLTRYPHQGLTSEQTLKAKNDARTTLVQAFVGIAVASGALVTYRTFRHNRAEQNRTYELQQTEQVNDFFAKAVDQLGHQHAPVRLGALYSLEQLAQAHIKQRTSVADVLCGYLRMPYTPAAGSEDAQQELQVRLTTQRLLAAHLRPPKGVPGDQAQGIAASTEEEFWPGVALNLMGSVLVDLDFSGISAASVRFDGATLTGSTSFIRATFTGDAVFAGATFTGPVRFVEAAFIGGAKFGRVTFSARARFDRATFTADAVFDESVFDGDARFDAAVFARSGLFNETKFTGDALFGLSQFSGDARFGRADFARMARFANVTFHSGAAFANTTFNGTARFGGAAFTGSVRFDRATFVSRAQFDQATFTDDAGLLGAQVLNLDDPDLDKGDGNARWIWPAGWTVRRVWNDPTRGTLVRATDSPEHDTNVGNRPGPSTDET